uniref:Translocase of outer mitochondrial membrane 5 n=1 Tax=Laticauda laticaudata TaxID=8630 RepID=A0A8C5SXI9_LATLA
MFRLEGLGPKLDPEELKRKMREDVLSSIRNFLVYVAVLRISECLPRAHLGRRPRAGDNFPRELLRSRGLSRGLR